MKMPKELIKEYVKSENFTSTTDIMEGIKSMFADVLNEVLQCELDEQLGYDKHVRTESGQEKKNYRNGSTKRKMKTQLGEVEITVPRDRNGEYEPKIISKYQRNADGLEDKADKGTVLSSCSDEGTVLQTRGRFYRPVCSV